MSERQRLLYRFSPFCLDPHAFLLTRNEESVHLGQTAFDILRYLVEHAGQVVTYEEFKQAIWFDVSLDDYRDSLQHHIRDIRKELSTHPKGARLIENVRGRGYKFTAEVTQEPLLETEEGPIPHAMAVEDIQADQDVPNPYRHLKAFQESDAPYFYGRDTWIQYLVAMIQQEPHPPFIALVGPSGSGKSSLVLAGVVPCLRDPHWQIAIFRPKRDPFGELAQVLAPLLYPHLDDELKRRAGERLAERFTTPKERQSIADVMAMLARDSPETQLLLIVDQFEELYTLPEPQQHQQRLFLRDLESLVQGTTPCRVLVTLRAGFPEQILSHGAFAKILNAYRPIFLESMSQEELLQAIQEPARKLGVQLEDGLAELICRELEQEPGSLPLLQFALARLWELRRGRRLTHQAYEEIGGVRKALTEYADTILSQFAGEEKRLQRIFVQLVQPGPGTEHTRQVATRAQVGENNWPLVCQLADVRLVVIGHDKQGQPTVEVAHEALIRYWPRLKQWIDHYYAFRLWQTRLRQDMQKWEDSNCDDGALLLGIRLVEAEAMMAEYREDVQDARERKYISESVQHRDRALAESNRSRREREWLLQRNHLAQLLLLVPLWAGLMGAFTRMGLSWSFGSFVDLPGFPGVPGSPPVFDAIMKPLWHGFIGTYLGGVGVLYTLEAVSHEREAIPFHRALWLAAIGVAWGASIASLISVSYAQEHLGNLGWWKIFKLGYPITGICWGVGLAIGTYMGDRLGAYSSNVANLLRKRFLGGLCGACCFLLFAAPIMFVFKEASSPDLRPRIWGEIVAQNFSIWAVLTCFYWQKQRFYRASPHLAA